jgi:hypothetical protein
MTCLMRVIEEHEAKSNRLLTARESSSCGTEFRMSLTCGGGGNLTEPYPYYICKA